MALPAYLLYIGLATLIAAVALVFWHKILEWAQESLLPWLEEHLPFLAEGARTAFVQLDRVAVAVRRAAKSAWLDLRGYLLKQVVKVRKRTGVTALVIIEEWLRVEPESETVVHRTTEREVEWEELPDDVREQFLKQQTTVAEKNVTAGRDTEFELLEMQN